MVPLTHLTRYDEAQEHYSKEALWDLYDGDRERFNIAHECIDRHPAERAAIHVVRAEGGIESYSFGELSHWSARFAHYLKDRGCVKGDRIALMLEPSLPFYLAAFGAMKAGMIVVPLFTLFGPDGLRLRIDDCNPKILLTDPSLASVTSELSDVDVLFADDDFLSLLKNYPDTYNSETTARDMAVYQYTSGTTRELPDAVRHSHGSVVVLSLAALYGTGVRPGEVFMCPSSPAWGHGMWHGTIAPLAFGATIVSYQGKFDPRRLLEGLRDLKVENLSAAATHYRMMRRAGEAGKYDFALKKLSFTGEPMDSETETWVRETFGIAPASFYGTTEVGVILVSYPGAPDFEIKPGALGKPPPGVRLQVQGPDGSLRAPGDVGEIMIWRRDAWQPTKDLGVIDEEGYFYHRGRADDVIISAGWTMSAVEIEDILLKHPDVDEAAVIGVPDEERGQVVKGFIISKREGDAAFAEELQVFTKTRLSLHEYPRLLSFPDSLPKTPAGKVNRKVLRDAEQAKT